MAELQRLELHPRENAQTCPYCHGSLVEGDEQWPCPQCATRHHRECVSAHGGCAILGCASAPRADASRPALAANAPPALGRPPSFPRRILSLALGLLLLVFGAGFVHAGLRASNRALGAGSAAGNSEAIPGILLLAVGGALVLHPLAKLCWRFLEAGRHENARELARRRHVAAAAVVIGAIAVLGGIARANEEWVVPVAFAAVVALALDTFWPSRASRP